MGLDQLLLQDSDGTLLGASAAGTVVPRTPRTEAVWSPLCSSDFLDVEGIDAMVCPGTTVQLLEVRNLDSGAKDFKFGPLVLDPEDEEDNGFQAGTITSGGASSATCPCGWDFSFYHILIKPATTYYADVMSVP
jgi:hypothetical protein